MDSASPMASDVASIAAAGEWVSVWAPAVLVVAGLLVAFAAMKMHRAGFGRDTRQAARRALRGRSWESDAGSTEVAEPDRTPTTGNLSTSGAFSGDSMGMAMTNPQDRSDLPDGLDTRMDAMLDDGRELTERLASVLDEKAARLEELLEHAERRIAELEKLVAANGWDGIGDGTGLSLRRPTENAAGGIEPMTEKIYALADSGLKPLQIAQQLHQHIGKIELILALRGK